MIPFAYLTSEVSCTTVNSVIEGAQIVTKCLVTIDSLLKVIYDGGEFMKL